MFQRFFGRHSFTGNNHNQKNSEHLIDLRQVVKPIIPQPALFPPGWVDLLVGPANLWL